MRKKIKKGKMIWLIKKIVTLQSKFFWKSEFKSETKKI